MSEDNFVPAEDLLPGDMVIRQLNYHRTPFLVIQIGEDNGWNDSYVKIKYLEGNVVYQNTFYRHTRLICYRDDSHEQ